MCLSTSSKHQVTLNSSVLAAFVVALTKHPIRSSIKKEISIFLKQFRVYFITVMKLPWQECEAAGHIVVIVHSKERDECWGLVHLQFLTQSGTSAHRMMPSTCSATPPNFVVFLKASSQAHSEESVAIDHHFILSLMTDVLKYVWWDELRWKT